MNLSLVIVSGSRSNAIVFATVLAISMLPVVGSTKEGHGADELSETANAPAKETRSGSLRPKTGKDIFVHRWLSGQPAGGDGDGLGPMYNEVSCVACHIQGGVGGSGGLDKNVVLLTIEPGKGAGQVGDVVEHGNEIHPGLLEKTSIQSRFLQRLAHSESRGIMPAEVIERVGRSAQAFAGQQSTNIRTSILLHKFSTAPQYATALEKFTGYGLPIGVTPEESAELAKALATRPVIRKVHESGLKYVLSQRNTPALFGVGLIDNVPNSYLRELELLQRKQGLVTGRVAGKFGWKGQTFSLDAFVRNACANELGLNVVGAPQPQNPYDDTLVRGIDLDSQQVSDLTAFVRELAAPREMEPADESGSRLVRGGKQAFVKAGCATCHRRNLRGRSLLVKGIYSDLLLHDMGEELADPVPANDGSRSRGGGYSGSSSSNLVLLSSSDPKRNQRILNKKIKRARSRARQEWRTPPLWGVAGSAPYLHDGRAATLTEAILQHGGEGRFSVKRFQRMPAEDRHALIRFLRTLVPPEIEES